MGFIIDSRLYAHQLEARAVDSTFDDEDAAASRWLWSLQAQLRTELLVNELTADPAQMTTVFAPWPDTITLMSTTVI
jgi:hypothetical protein